MLTATAGTRRGPKRGGLTQALAMALLLVAGPVSKAGVITLDFVGIDSYPDASDVLIENYYDGGAASDGNVGPNYGVTFSSGATLLCLNTASDPTCSNTSMGGQGLADSQDWAMYFPTTNPTMDVSGGFTSGFSMVYSNPNGATVGVQVWSGLDGTGTLLASASLAQTTAGTDVSGCYDALYCPFADFSLAFSGTGESIVFTGTANQSVYNDITFGSTVVGGTAPEPGSGLLLAGGLAICGFVLRRSRRFVRS